MAHKRIFFATDLHGSEVCFRKFLNAAKAYQAEILVCGGDITGKMMVPIANRGDGSYRTYLRGTEIILNTKSEVEAIASLMRNAGLYPINVTEEELEGMGDATQIELRFEVEMRAVLEKWVALAEERLRPIGVPCVMMPGNDDWDFVNEVLSQSDYLINAHRRVIDLDIVQLVGLGNANLTPWRCPLDISEEELASRIDELVQEVRDLDRCIFDIHVPPFGSQLDIAPELDDTFKPKINAGGISMVPVGSTAVRAAIERYQPLLGLHGHIHESRGVSRLGRTVCVNPGSEYQNGILNGALIAISDQGQLTWALTSG